MRNLFALLLAAALILGMFAGCASTEKTADGNTPAADTPSSSQPTADDTQKSKDLSILWSSGGNGEYVNFTGDHLKQTYGLNS